MRKWLLIMGILCGGGELFSLSVGGEACLFWPEGGMPSVEFAGGQEVSLPWGFFLEGRGMYYRVFGLGYQYHERVWGMFSGDMVALVAGGGWQLQWRRWLVRMKGHLGMGWVLEGELREIVAREFLRAVEGREALMVKSSLKGGVFPGGGVSLHLGYQWKRMSVGLSLGYLGWYGKVPLEVEWIEFEGGMLTLRKGVFDGAFLLRGIQSGVMFQVVL